MVLVEVSSAEPLVQRLLRRLQRLLHLPVIAAAKRQAISVAQQLFRTSGFFWPQPRDIARVSLQRVGLGSLAQSHEPPHGHV